MECRYLCLRVAPAVEREEEGAACLEEVVVIRCDLVGEDLAILVCATVVGLAEVLVGRSVGEVSDCRMREHDAEPEDLRRVGLDLECNLVLEQDDRFQSCSRDRLEDLDRSTPHFGPFPQFHLLVQGEVLCGLETSVCRAREILRIAVSLLAVQAWDAS